jgi:O-antigen/teichoic acid export membrane protein
MSGRRLARNALYNVLGQGLPLVVGLAALPITLRALGDARFGLLGLAWAILGYVGALDLGLGRATTKYVAEYLAAGDDARLRTVGTLAVASQTALGVLGGVLFALLAPVLVDDLLRVTPALRDEARGMMLALAVSVPFVVLGASLRAMLEAAQRFDLVNIIRTPTSAAVLLIPAIAASLGARLPAIVVLLVGVRVVACAASVAAIRRAIPAFRWTPAFSWEALRPLLGYGGWVSVSNVISPLLVYLERFLLAALAGVAAVGYYTVPSEIVMRVLIVPGALSGALFPALSASDGGSTEQLLGRPLRFLLLILAPIVTALVMGAGPLLSAWLGREYAARSATAFVILAIGVLINGLAHLPYAYLLGRGRPDLPAKFHLLELPLYAAAAWLLIRQAGVNGAAIAWTSRVTVDAALLVAAVWRLSGVSPGRLLGERGGRAAVAVLGLGAVGAASYALGAQPVIRYTLSLGSLLVFGVAVWRLVLNDVERAGLRAVLR